MRGASLAGIGAYLRAVGAALLSCALAASLSACALPASEDAGSSDATADGGEQASFRVVDIGSDLEHVGSLELAYAENFTVDYYEDGYALICISDGSRYLVVPQGLEEPADLDPDIVTLQQPLDDIYLVASDTMCLLDALDMVGRVSVSALEADDWSVASAVEAMQSGDIVYGGKYSAPDYDVLLSRGVTLAIESTMVNHVPEVREKLLDIGIEVLTEYASYESDPFGRMEWIKLYGVLFDAEELAGTVFDEQVAEAADAIEGTASGKTVAFFYINSNGAAVVRRPGDYITKMIELAGASYAFSDVGDDDESTSVTLEMESFYALAKDADILIYNSSVAGDVDSVEQLVGMNSLLGQFAAVQSGEVWCAKEDMYQHMTSTGTIISELHAIVTGVADDDGLEFFERVP